MNRESYLKNPQIINQVIFKGRNNSRHKTPIKIFEVATRNESKLAEYKRILDDYVIIGKDLKVPEIQSLDPYKVTEEKARLAWEKNDCNPILVEDTSLEIFGLGGRPGTYIVDFAEDVEMRRMIVERWLNGCERRALARVIIGVFDGVEYHFREGKVEGLIAEKLAGTNGFGWDDMFIPSGQKGGRKNSKTFAQMTGKEKDKFSMRRLALEEVKNRPFDLKYSVMMLPEPYNSEIKRLRLRKLNDIKAQKFAFSLEVLNGKKKMNPDYEILNYEPIYSERNKFYGRFSQNLDSPSIGLLFTDIDRASLKLYENGNPYIWQMGPKRRKLALAQRAEYFLNNQNLEVSKVLDKMDGNGILARKHRRSATIEAALGTNSVGWATQTKALAEIGYKKISSFKKVSRTTIADYGLFNKVGKYARSVLGIGSVPPISGWRDVLVTAAVGHMPVFTSRNSVFAAFPEKQVALIKSAKKVLRQLDLGKSQLKRAERNIGAAIGCGNIQEEINHAVRLKKDAGVTLFRIYTINGDPRVIEMAKALRKEFGDEIELFVGQISDKEQALRLIEDDIKADGLVFGHGGGMQCTSATNGMALTTLEELYSVISDQRFNETSLVAEGGVGTAIGSVLILGVDLVLCNQKIVKGAIELSDIFFEHKHGGFCHPYHGSASAPTMIIEATNPDLMENRLYYSGRTKKIEGKPGYMFYQEKINSMAFHVNEYRHYAARTLADLGVSNMKELREFLQSDDRELFRIISTEAANVAAPHTER